VIPRWTRDCRALEVHVLVMSGSAASRVARVSWTTRQGTASGQRPCLGHGQQVRPGQGGHGALTVDVYRDDIAEGSVVGVHCDVVRRRKGAGPVLRPQKWDVVGVRFAVAQPG
jgi:hypothetical protein